MNKTVPRSGALRVLKILFKVSAGLVFLHLVFQYVNMEVFYQQKGQFYELSNRFDLDDESSVATWFSQLLLLAIGISALLAGYLSSKLAVRRLWYTVGGLGVLFSLDEIAGLHERALQSIHVLLFKDNAPTGFENAWLIVLPFILILATLLAWRMRALLPRRTTLLFISSGVIFMTGAVLVDLITPTVYRETFLQQGLFVAIEEGFELFGTVTALYAILLYLEKLHHRQLSRAWHELTPK